MDTFLDGFYQFGPIGWFASLTTQGGGCLADCLANLEVRQNKCPQCIIVESNQLFESQTGSGNSELVGWLSHCVEIYVISKQKSIDIIEIIEFAMENMML